VKPPGAPGVGAVGRLAGIGLVLGAVFWPLGLAAMGSAALAPTGAGVPSAREIIALPALAAVLLSAGVAALEHRASTTIRLRDLVGDLSIGTATVLLVLAAMLDTLIPAGPGLLLLLAGSVVFGFAGFDGRRRPRWASAFVGIGAGATLSFLALGPLLGPEQTALVGLLLYSLGWGWLGIHLALDRPLTQPGEV
jgi:hypothetical protein